MSKKPIKIVLTGAPSSGKSSTMKALGARLPQAILVPESAVMLLSGGFPAPALGDLEQIRLFQKAIFAVQDGLEALSARQRPDASHMVLDRAKLDGAGFWPPGPEDYMRAFGVDWSAELLAYDHVVFLELPSEAQFGGVHQTRFHDYEQSLESGRRLEHVWSRHPSFHRVPASASLERKIDAAVAVVRSLIQV